MPVPGFGFEFSYRTGSAYDPVEPGRLMLADVSIDTCLEW